MEPRDRNCICLNELAGWGNTGASRAMCKEDSLRSGHRVRRRHAQLDGQPRARRPKLAFDGGQRDIQRLRCFLERQSAEVPLLQDQAASLIHGCEAEGAEPEPGSVPSVASLHRDDNDPLSHLLLGQPHRATGLEPTTHIV